MMLRMPSCESVLNCRRFPLPKIRYKSSSLPLNIQKIESTKPSTQETQATTAPVIPPDPLFKASKTFLTRKKNKKKHHRPLKKMARTQTLLTLALTILSPLATATPTPPTQDPTLAQFEERFVNSLPYTSDNATTLRLVGFKRMALPAADVAAFEKAWNDPPSEWRRRDEGSATTGRHEEHFWYDRVRREVRVYFPVEGALLRRGGAEQGDGDEFVEADGLGQVVGVGEMVKRDVDGEGRARAVVGRRATDQVSGVEGNVIRDGIMYVLFPIFPFPRLT